MLTIYPVYYVSVKLNRGHLRLDRRLVRAGGALSLCLLLFLAPALLAESNYLAPGQPDSIALLAPPPVAGSAEEVADLASARAVFKARTPDEQARAFKDASLSLFLFTPAIGPSFQPGKFPKVETLFQKVKQDIGEPIDTVKQHWQRRRPYQLDAELTLGRPERSFAYPSGHSTRGTVYALVVAELFPDKKEAILAIGRDIGWDRVLIGKHFPTDIYAARVLGQAIMRDLQASPAFQRDLAEAKAEVQTASASTKAGLHSDTTQLPYAVPTPESGGK